MFVTDNLCDVIYEKDFIAPYNCYGAMGLFHR